MKARGQRRAAAARAVDDAVVTYGRPPGESRDWRLASSPQLAALREAGTAHIYADTADTEELEALLAAPEGALPREVDGNTANQPLVQKVIARTLDAGEPEAWARALRGLQPGLAEKDLAAFVYAIVCGRIGNDIVRQVGAGRPWEVSLQLHMRLGDDPEAAVRVGRCLRRMVPSAFVKVPFTPTRRTAFSWRATSSGRASRSTSPRPSPPVRRWRPRSSPTSP